MIFKIKRDIEKELMEIFKQVGINQTPIIEKPKDRLMGDYALPCFQYAKEFKKSPQEIATTISEKIKLNIVDEIKVVGGYINLFLNKKEITQEVIKKIILQQENYGNLSNGNGQTIVLDYSAPNIAKPFGVGHLRSTVIGNALRKILQKTGCQTVGINYLGDYGTQFGKLIYAYKTWGDENNIKINPIDELKRVYVKFHEEAQKNPAIEDKGREWFKKLEDKDEEALKLWEWFREESLKSFAKTYELLNINDFDSNEGEAFFNDKMAAVISELEEKHLLEKSDGAMIVKIGDDIPPALIERSDGASLYITRDIAAIFYRKKKYRFDEILYVVGNEQTLHFNQLKRLVAKMGYEWSDSIHHISFGMILQDGKKMATRKGTTVKLHDVLEDAISLANKYITEKNPNLSDKEEISKIIGVGAVIFNDLKNYRTNDIEFNLDEILKFEGETAPYIQYTYVRINSMLENKQNSDININHLTINEYIWNIIMQLIIFEEIIDRAKNNYDPSELAKYIINLAQDYNKFYANEKIISDDLETREFNLNLSEATAVVLKEGMRLLGIKMPNQM